jgi:starch-binding outer membrane protein, SusD/RagB family
LFELQWVFTTDYAAANTMVSQITFSNDIANGDGWGGDLGASYYMLSLYDGLINEDGSPGFTVDQRLKATFMLPGFHYPEISQTVRDENGIASEQELIFPAPGEEAGTSFASPKKYVVGKAKDLQAKGGNAIAQRYPNNTYMLRLSEIYLIYAEAALGNSESTTDAKALEYFNAVHERAKLPKHEGELTWQDIYEERMKEFAGEGMSWYDLVRLHYYNPQRAYDIVNNQERGLYVIRPNQMPNPTSWRVIVNEGAVEESRANASSGNFLLPIPAAEASQAPNLRNPAVPYDFED